MRVTRNFFYRVQTSGKEQCSASHPEIMEMLELLCCCFSFPEDGRKQRNEIGLQEAELQSRGDCGRECFERESGLEAGTEPKGLRAQWRRQDWLGDNQFPRFEDGVACGEE